MVLQTSIRIVGLRELRRDLRRVDPELARELKRVFNESGEPIAETARVGVPKLSRRLEKTIRVSSTQREGRVRMGTPTRRPPLVGGYRPRTTRRFERGGQVLLDAFYEDRSNQQQVHDAMDRGIDRVTRKAGLR